MPPATLGPRRTRSALATAAWERLMAAEPVIDPDGWFTEQAGLRGLEVWPDDQHNLWALNGDPEEESTDAHPGLALMAPLTGGGSTGPSRALMLALAAVDVLNQLGFEPDMPVSVVASASGTVGLPDDGARRVARLLELTDADRALPAFSVSTTRPPGQTRELAVDGEPGDGRDPLLTFAMTVLAVAKQARLGDARSATTHVRVERTDSYGRPTRLRADVRIDGIDPDAVFAAVERQGRDRAGRDGTVLTLAQPTHEVDLAARCARLLRVEPTVDAEHVGPTPPAGMETATLATATGAPAAGQIATLVRLVEEFAG